MISEKAILGLPDYQITDIEEVAGEVRIRARYTGPVSCAHCGSMKLRQKDRRVRSLRHEFWGTRAVVLELDSRKFLCPVCGHYFWQRFPGVLPRCRATEPFRRYVFQQHWDGISRSRLGRRLKLSGATVERWCQDVLDRELAKGRGQPCPRVLGIDEHFFSRRLGYATTFCDLSKHRVFDVVPGRSEAALQAWLNRLAGRQNVRVVCIDLSSTYRALVRRYFPNARIVADRFHVIRLINHHFLAAWRDIDPVGSKHRGLLSLIRRHSRNLRADQQVHLNTYFDTLPVMRSLHEFRNRLHSLLMHKHPTRKQCARLVPQLLQAIDELRQAGLPQLATLGDTLHNWQQEIATMWRFTKNNGITEGFHTKMEALQRQAYGFRNFSNYRRRVKVLCS